VFKFLESQGQDHLDACFLEISRNQENHIPKLIRTQRFGRTYRY